ncbi:MAG TPA: sigma-54 dependent transcriptional regulator [Gemmataceae bacterium]|nr:sigma-54 dependent transcriptional regulator [Gemmataceae bacterium]
MPRLLVVDDEPNILYSFQKTFPTDGLEVVTASTGREGIETARRQPPDAVILDVRLADMSGLEVFDAIRRIDPRVPVVLITAYAATDTAIEAMKRGAFEYLLKPLDFHQLREVIQRALELSRFRHVPAVFDEAELAESVEGVERIVGRSLAMQEVYKAIGRVAPRDVPVLITGESGTGKELAARAVFHHSSRPAAAFLTLNCAAIPETLLESELFGHEKGAFTGADRRRIGKFEQADKGTLFLDEIGDMTSATQAKVLRVLQEQRFERVGGEETIQTDVRVIAATNKTLEGEVSAGRFRRDLLYRLNVYTIHLPPLRERGDDIPLLVEHFVRRSGRDLGRPIRSVAPEAMERLRSYDWPGNVRQLQSVLKYGLIQAPADVLTLDCLPESLRSGVQPRPQPPLAATGGVDFAAFANALLQAGESDIYRRACLEMDRVVLDAVLRHVQGNQLRAAALLGISRTTLRAKLRALGMTADRTLFSEPERTE